MPIVRVKDVWNPHGTFKFPVRMGLLRHKPPGQPALIAGDTPEDVVDISGEPISYVIIEEINSNLENSNWTMSDDNGGFTINVDKESDILFKRIGFKNITIKPNERLSKYVTMPFDNISLETVDVYGRNENEYLRNKTSFNKELKAVIIYTLLLSENLFNFGMSICATCPNAFTPASVLPAP